MRTTLEDVRRMNAIEANALDNLRKSHGNSRRRIAASNTLWLCRAVRRLDATLSRAEMGELEASRQLKRDIDAAKWAVS